MTLTVDEYTDTWGLRFVLDPAFCFCIALMDTFPRISNPTILKSADFDHVNSLTLQKW